MGLRFLALACLVGAAFAGPVQRQSEWESTKKCKHSPDSLIHYGRKIYVYRLVSHNNITSPGTQKHSATLEAKVEIHVLSDCEGFLKLTDISLNQKGSQDEMDDMKRALEMPMRYLRKDDEIAKVFPSSEESTMSLNTKKAVLSLFVIGKIGHQKSVKVEENDSFGKCLTDIKVQHYNGETVITKEKDLKTCTKQTFHLNFLEQASPIVSILNENRLNYTLRIKDEIITSAECQEVQKLKSPLEKGNSMILFSGKLNLTLIETRPAEKLSWEEPSTEEEISFSIDEPRQGDNTVRKVEKVLKQLCSKNRIVIDITASKNYILLVSLVRKCSYKDLLTIYESLRDGRLCDSKKVRDIFIDTLPVILTDSSMRLMSKILLNDDATVLKSKYWPATFALKQNPTDESVDAVLPLMQRYSQFTSTLIGVTSMVHRLCSSEDCSQMKAVNEVAKVYSKHLGPGCSSDNEKQVVTSLRALGNMGYHGEAHQNIIACATDKTKSLRIRMFAIRAFRRWTKELPEEFVNMCSDREEDDEIRIELLRSIFEHPNKKHLSQIKRIVDTETKEQVSAYMNTFLQNINKTQSLRYRNLKSSREVMEMHPPNVDYWTNSKNIEISAHNTKLDVGVSVEANMIHSEKHTPKSSNLRLDIDLLGKNMNIFEIGLGTHGLDDIIGKLFEMKDKIPKLEDIRNRLAQNPTFQEIKDEYKYLSPSKVFEDISPEASMYLRALDTDIWEISTTDMSSMKEMIKVAELMSKLARGEKADFSHSIVLVNSKLTIPSATGRSYSIDLVGSSTVGVTAETKADFLKLPRHADVVLQFNPSLDVEIRAGVGIESTTGHPDVKLVSRLHFESDMDARFQVKDGHAALASLSFPSEHIALVNVSTSVVEIDKDNNEKHVFEKVQKKVDYCLNLLEKPLGLTSCTTISVPKPFVRNSFPYIVPSVEAEFSIKKTDTFKSYVLSVELPSASSKQSAPSMKYRAVFDTPGSRINRRFVADLEVKKERDQKGVMIELSSPLMEKTIAGSCLFTKRDELTRGSLELHKGETRLVSANLHMNSTETRSRKMIKIEGEYSTRNENPAKIYGTIAVTKGRKEHYSIDFKTNKPHSEPLAFKATIVKEGQLELSSRSDFRLSSEASITGPRGSLKITKTLTKQSKPTQSLSTNVALDYQLKGKKKETLTIYGSSQKGSSKLHTNIKVASTQFPEVNLHLTSNMQRESKETQTSDLKITDVTNPHKVYLELKQKYEMPKTGQGRCFASINIPPRDIYYNLSVNYDINLNDRINFEADLGYKQDKHLKTIVDLHCQSKIPWKSTGKVSVEYPGGQMSYMDEMKESNGVMEGRSILQLPKGNYQMSYKYKISSNDSKFHHEIESSIQTPNSRNPINGKASIELNSESLAIVGQVGPHYALQAHLKDDGVSRINFKLPMIEGIIKTREENEKIIDLDVKLKTKRPQHIIGSVIAKLGEKKKMELRIQPDVDRAPERIILLSTTLEMISRDSKDNFVGAWRAKVDGYVDISCVEEGEISPLGSYQLTCETSNKNGKKSALKLERKTGDERATMTLEVTKDNVKKVKIETEAELRERYFLLKANLISLDGSFKDIQMYMKHQETHSGSSKNVHTALSFKKKEELYSTEWNSVVQSNKLEIKGEIQTPHEKYEKTSVDLSIQVSDNAVSSSVSIECLKDKTISIQTEFKTNNKACSLVGKLRTPFEIAKEAQLYVTLDNHHSDKSIEANIDLNNERICEIQGNLKKSSEEMKIESRVKLTNLELQEFQVKLESSPSHALVSGSMKLKNNREFSVVSEIKEEGSVIYSSTKIDTPHENFKTIKSYLSIEIQPSKRNLLCYLDKNGERIGDAEISIATLSQLTELKGRLKIAKYIPEISAHVKSEKTGKSILLSANVMKGTSPLFSTSFNKLSYHGGEKLLMKTKSLKDTLLDLEMSKDLSDKNSIRYILKLTGPTNPISIRFSKIQNDENSVSTELEACREVDHTEVCYRCKSHHKNLIHSENYRFHQIVTMDFEKSKGGSYSKPVAKVHVVMTSTENDYRSKMILEFNEKKYGYELKAHLRKDENDRCSLDSHFYLSQLVSRVRCSILHSHHRGHFECEAIPNTDNPTSKLGVEVKKEYNPDNKAVSGLIKLSHPRLSQPLLLTGKVQPVGHFVKAKLALHFNPVWGKVLMLEILPNIEQEAYGIRSIVYKLYTDDKSIDASLEAYRHKSRSEEKMGYQWKCIKNGDEITGGLALTLSDKNNGKPKTMKLSYFSPSGDYEVQGSVAQGADDMNLSISSAGRKLKEIRVSFSDSCANIEITKSGPLIKSVICINKREGSALQLLKVDLQYRQHKCLDIRLGVDQEKPHNIKKKFKCSQERSCQAMRESLRELVQDLIRKGKHLRKDVHERVRHIKKDVLGPHVRKVRKSLRDLKEDLSSKVKSKLNQHDRLVKEYIRKLKEAKDDILNHIQSAIPSSIKEIYQKLYHDYHKVVVRYFRKALRYWPPICEVGWYCSDLKSAFRRFDAKEVRTQIHRKINNIKKSLQFRMIWPSDVFNFIRKTVETFQRYVMRIFGKVVGKTIMIALRRFAKQVEKFIRKKAEEFMDNILDKFRHIVSSDKDLQTAQDLILNAKNKLVKDWRNREHIARSTTKQLKSNIEQNLRNHFDREVKVIKYDPDNGEIRLKIRQPLTKEEIEGAKHGLFELLRNLRKYLHI